jgi:cytochrome c biogenesis protein CcdA
MALFVLSFIAGVLTIAAPCILPLLPVIIGGSLDKNAKKQNVLRPIIVTASLAVSVVLFTLILKATTSLLGVPQFVWQLLSGFIVIALGLNFLFPHMWEFVSQKLGLYKNTNKALGKTIGNQSVTGGILTGFALGPVFNSCSPTYAFIIATVLPVSFAQGLAYLIAYAVGLSVALLLVAYTGQAVISKLGWMTDPRGWFTKVLGILFIAVGFVVLLGVDKKIQTYVLEQGWYDPISNIEKSLR